VTRGLVAVVLVAIAIAVAWVVDRRVRADAPTQGGWSVPTQLDRADFQHPEVPWLVALFTSATCDSCRGTVEKAEVLASAEVAVEEAEVTARKELHDRYGIDAVPTTVIADADGVVQRSFVGPVTATDLWGALAELRSPGSTPAC
jgi:hypothetical protein